MKFDKSVFSTLALISQLGFSVLVPILLCVFIGVFLKEKYEISIIVPLIIIGVLSGVRNAYYLLKQASEAMKGDEDEER